MPAQLKKLDPKDKHTFDKLFPIFLSHINEFFPKMSERRAMVQLFARFNNMKTDILTIQEDGKYFAVGYNLRIYENMFREWDALTYSGTWIPDVVYGDKLILAQLILPTGIKSKDMKDEYITKIVEYNNKISKIGDRKIFLIIDRANKSIEDGYFFAREWFVKNGYKSDLKIDYGENAGVWLNAYEKIGIKNE